MATKRSVPSDFETSPVVSKQSRNEGHVISSMPVFSFPHQSFTSSSLQLSLDQPVSIQLATSDASSHIPLADEVMDLVHSSPSQILHPPFVISSTNTPSLAVVTTSGSPSLSRQPICSIDTKSKGLSGTKSFRSKVLKTHKTKLALLKLSYDALLKEKFFLESGGNFMDFLIWKKKPNALRDQYLKQQDLEVGDVCLSSTSNTTIIQIPLSTVSPTLHSTPPKGPTHFSPTRSMGFSASPRPATRAHASFSSVYENSHEDIVMRARHEAEVIKAISELRKEGLWCASRLPKVHEPARIKTHWDYLLEEMQWLAADFANEKRWKINAARKVCTVCTIIHRIYRLFCILAIKRDF